MKLLVNTLIILAIGFLAYLLYSSINEPINFKAEYDTRKGKVINKLKDIRKAQEYYKSITGNYAPSFDSLSHVLKNDSFPKVKVFPDPENDGEFIFETTYVKASDSLANWDVNIDSLPYVPYSDDAKFSVFADTLTYQSTLTHVVEVGTPYSSFMGEYADPKYKKYNDRYNPNDMIRFGDRTKPSISGNWE